MHLSGAAHQSPAECSRPGASGWGVRPGLGVPVAWLGVVIGFLGCVGSSSVCLPRPASRTRVHVLMWGGGVLSLRLALGKFMSGTQS